jgi:hypothetical protein
MLFHVVLFRPRRDLTDSAVADLVAALDEVLRSIPSIRRFHLGQRVVHGAGYEALVRDSLDYAAVVEFDDLHGLAQYLEHPAHHALGSRFMQSLEASAIFDYEMREGSSLLAGPGESVLR